MLTLEMRSNILLLSVASWLCLPSSIRYSVQCLRLLTKINWRHEYYHFHKIYVPCFFSLCGNVLFSRSVYSTKTSHYTSVVVTGLFYFNGCDYLFSNRSLYAPCQWKVCYRLSDIECFSEASCLVCICRSLCQKLSAPTKDIYHSIFNDLSYIHHI